MTPHRNSVFTLGVALCAGMTLPALAAPQGGSVVAGSATIDTVGKNTTITTQTQRTILEFDQFNIANSERVVFNQPDANSAVLNRITGGQRTTIEGFLGSNGQVYLVNPAGVSFSPTAVVNVGRIVAAGSNMDNADFLSGLDRFTDANGRVTNLSANILGREGVVLVGKNVTNDGTLTSEDGTIVLVSGKDILLQDGPDGQILIKLEGFGTTDGRQSKLINNGTIDAGDNGSVYLGAGDLLGLSVLRSGRVEAAKITVELGDVPWTLSEPSSRFDTFSDTAAITINTSQLSYHADVAPNDRITLNAPGGFVNLGGGGDDLGPGIVNGQPFPPDNGGGEGGGVDVSGGGGGVGFTLVDGFARFLPTDPLVVSGVSPATVDSSLVSSLQDDLGIAVKGFDEQPLLEYLVAATVLNDLNLTPGSGTGASGGGASNRVSANRLDYNAAQNAVGAYDNVFYVSNSADDGTNRLATAGGVGDAAGAASAEQANASASVDQTQRVRAMIQQAADRYMADAEVTDIDPVAFVEWLKLQDPETLEALAGLNELVNDAMPNLGLGSAELANFKQWTYGKIAPQGVSLRTLDELVAAAGRS